MANYLKFYVVFGVIFLAGVVGYWVVSRALRDPRRIYVEGDAAEAPDGSSAQLGKA